MDCRLTALHGCRSAQSVHRVVRRMVEVAACFGRGQALLGRECLHRRSNCGRRRSTSLLPLFAMGSMVLASRCAHAWTTRGARTGFVQGAVGWRRMGPQSHARIAEGVCRLYATTQQTPDALRAEIQKVGERIREMKVRWQSSWLDGYHHHCHRFLYQRLT